MKRLITFLIISSIVHTIFSFEHDLDVTFFTGSNYAYENDSTIFNINITNIGTSDTEPFGIMLFVAIPLPITGAYTGTLGAWILGMSRRKTILAALGGVIISGIIVSIVATLGIQAFSFFIKEI